MRPNLIGFQLVEVHEGFDNLPEKELPPNLFVSRLQQVQLLNQIYLISVGFLFILQREAGIQVHLNSVGGNLMASHAIKSGALVTLPELQLSSDFY